MMTAIRQQGHIAEHTHAGPRDLYEGIRGSGRHGTGHYNTWDMSHGHADDAYWQDGENPSWSAEWPTESYHGTTPYDDNDYYYDEDGYDSYVVEDDEGYQCCAACQQYLVDDEEEYWRDNDTDTDEEEFQAQKDMNPTELQQYLGDMTNATYESLKGEYLWAKRRFRSFGQNSFRFTRFPRKSWSLSMSSRKGGKRKGRKDVEKVDATSNLR